MTGEEVEYEILKVLSTDNTSNYQVGIRHMVDLMVNTPFAQLEILAGGSLVNDTHELQLLQFSANTTTDSNGVIAFDNGGDLSLTNIVSMDQEFAQVWLPYVGKRQATPDKIMAVIPPIAMIIAVPRSGCLMTSTAGANNTPRHNDSCFTSLMAVVSSIIQASIIGTASFIISDG